MRKQSANFNLRDIENDDMKISKKICFYENKASSRRKQELKILCF